MKQGMQRTCTVPGIDKTSIKVTCYTYFYKSGDSMADLPGWGGAEKELK